MLNGEHEELKTLAKQIVMYHYIEELLLSWILFSSIDVAVDFESNTKTNSKRRLYNNVKFKIY